MTRPTRLAVITYREWLNWVSYGEISLNNRAINYHPPESDKNFFDCLMKKAPVVSQTEDQAYLLALLRNKSDEEKIKWPDNFDLPIALVVSFHPMSSRGYALLKGDANRAYVKLGEPLYESHWINWVSAKKQDSEGMAAERLCQAFGLPKFNEKMFKQEQTESIFHLLNHPTDELKNRRSNDETQCSKLEHLLKKSRKLNRQPAYGWWLALSVYKDLLEIYAPDTVSDFEEFARSFSEDILPSLKFVELFDKPIISNMAATEFADQIADKFPLIELPDINLLQLAIIFHYQHTIHENGTVELDALGEDLTTLYSRQNENSKALATIAAHFIGRHLSITGATALHYMTTAQSSGSSESNLSNVIDIDRLPRVRQITTQQSFLEKTA